MNIPENCRECEHTNTCWAYYGGGLCRYREAINRRTNEQQRKGEKA